MSGPKIRLNAKAAETFGLALHELATNAVKYGSLSVGKGSVKASWRVDGDGDGPKLIFEWVELGGPKPPLQRGRKGFGSELMEKTLVFDLKARTSLKFEDSGLHCTIELPMTSRVLIGDMLE